MNKNLLRILVATILVGTTVYDVDAKGGSSFSGGSRSFSGGSSFGRSSSSGSSSGFFKPSSPSPAPKPTYTTPPTPRPVSPPPVSSAPAQKPSAPAPAPVQQAKPAEKAPVRSFSQESKTPVSSPDRKAVEAQKHADSAKAYREAQERKVQASASTQAPASTVTQSAPVQKAPVYDLAKIREARDRHTDQMASRIAQGQYRDREVRSQRFYGSSYNQPMPSYYSGGYHDSYDNPYFWYWLFNNNSVSERDRFIYHHSHEIDPQRLGELRTAYPDLSRSLDTMRTEGLRQDTTYVPTPLRGHEDLIFGDTVLKGATKKASEVNFMGVLSLVLLGIGLLFGLYYLLFAKKYKVKEGY